MHDNTYSFVDTNIWLYSFINSDEIKNKTSKNLIENTEIIVSSQVINELCFNLMRKAKFNETQIQNIISDFYRDFYVVQFNERITLKASELRCRYSFSFWDSLIVASALYATADIIYSEDMQNGLIIENKIKIINPFIEKSNLII